MREEHIMDALNMLDEAMIKEVDRVRDESGNNGIDRETEMGKNRDEKESPDMGNKNENEKGRIEWRHRAVYLSGACLTLAAGMGILIILANRLPEFMKRPNRIIADETAKKPDWTASDEAAKEPDRTASEETVKEPDRAASEETVREPDRTALEETAGTPDDGIAGETAETPDLPLLAIVEDIGEGMGYEGYLAYDISELVNANPWNNDMEIVTLPVFQNPIIYEDFCAVSGTDFEKMETFLRDLAGRLGIEEGSLMIADDAPDKEEQEEIKSKAGTDLPEGYFNPRRLIAQADGIRIEVDITMTALIEFNPAKAMSVGYRLNGQSYEEMLSIAQYLKDEYRELIKMENPVINVDGGDYNIYEEQTYHIRFFDGVDDLEERIVNYNFNQVSFILSSEEEGIWLIRIHKPNLSKKVGDYPIISVEKARELLLDGYFITSVPFGLPEADYIAKAELIYRYGEGEKYYMPYYRFYVEIPEEKGRAFDGAKTYGAYYVPAVESKYLSGLPVWDGNFH